MSRPHVALTQLLHPNAKVFKMPAWPNDHCTALLSSARCDTPARAEDSSAKGVENPWLEISTAYQSSELPVGPKSHLG